MAALPSCNINNKFLQEWLQSGWTSVPLQVGLILATWKPMCVAVWRSGCACSQQELPAFSWPQEIKVFPILKKHQGSRPAPWYWKQFPLSKASLLLIFSITGNLKSQQNVLCVFLLSARFRKKEIFEVFLTENTQSLPPPYTLSVQTSSSALEIGSCLGRLKWLRLWIFIRDW